LLVHKVDAKIELEIGGIIVVISPLSFLDKSEILAIGENDGGMLKNQLAMAVESIKRAVKDVKGIKNEDGSPYELKFADGCLSDDCFSDLLNLEISNSIIEACSQLVNGVPKSFGANIKVKKSKKK